ncbi:MAG: UDP-N-acetylmuramoyl-L-alanine--D-glutamate ligase [Candidatus Doudnabacteria bacterium]|nr:UDP-N-acetylmuramoyl-L-alanine--D-glutamate ligase [Candidatus Doudnabacteria bacterium]
MLDTLRGKKIAVVGLGKNNQQLAEFLKKQSIVFDVIDNWNNADELIGRLDLYEIIFRSPGLPYLSKAIQQAKEKGVVITSQTKLFFEVCPCKIIGVTGTKGKGTTSSLIAKILETAGKKVWLAGNIGKDPFEFYEQIKADDLVVLELSSFQLQDLEKSPHIAVVLSITPDHLNHHKDFDEYIKAKSNIIAHQSENDYAVLHGTLPNWFVDLGKAKKTTIDTSLVSSFERKLLGDHNLDNIAAALEVGKILGIDELSIKKAVAQFEPLPHRLSILKNVSDITYVDDGYSTNINPTIAAIDAIKSNIVLIIGGYDKGLDFTPLGEAIRQNNKIRGVVVIGQVTDKILKSLEGCKGTVATGAKNMSEILSMANKIAQKGDSVLFSPATSSFDQFKNETDRAEQFVNAVNNLQ